MKKHSLPPIVLTAIVSIVAIGFYQGAFPVDYVNAAELIGYSVSYIGTGVLAITVMILSTLALSNAIARSWKKSRDNTIFYFIVVALLIAAYVGVAIKHFGAPDYAVIPAVVIAASLLFTVIYFVVRIAVRLLRYLFALEWQRERIS